MKSRRRDVSSKRIERDGSYRQNVVPERKEDWEGPRLCFRPSDSASQFGCDGCMWRICPGREIGSDREKVERAINGETESERRGIVGSRYRPG
jgi:hypothetical protein